MAETPSEATGGYDGIGSSSQVEEREPKRRKMTFFVWVRVKDKVPVHYHCEELCVVSDLLQNVQAKEMLNVSISKLQLFACKSDANDPSKACIVCMIACHDDCRSFEIWYAFARLLS